MYVALDTINDRADPNVSSHDFCSWESGVGRLVYCRAERRKCAFDAALLLGRRVCPPVPASCVIVVEKKEQKQEAPARVCASEVEHARQARPTWVANEAKERSLTAVAWTVHALCSTDYTVRS